MRHLLSLLRNEWKDLELQIVEMNDEVERIASSDAACVRLRQIPGIGPLVATAIVASIGNGVAFHKGREFATWMGLVPKQHSTGGKAKLYGISKRGNSCPRRLRRHVQPLVCSREEDSGRRRVLIVTGRQKPNQTVDAHHGRVRRGIGDSVSWWHH